jgi:hypothetical protein
LASPDKKAFLLRLPPDVWAQLERLAANELRSVNGQIEYLLREGLARRTGANAAAPAAPAVASPATPPDEDSSTSGRRGNKQRK